MQRINLADQVYGMLAPKSVPVDGVSLVVNTAGTSISAVGGVLPAQFGNAGKFLQTNGIAPAWVTMDGGTF